MVLLLLKKGNLIVIFLNITAIGLQFSLLGFIALVNMGELCNYISKTWGQIGIFITLLGAFVNTGCLYFNYLTSRPKPMKRTIIWQLIGGLVSISIGSVLLYFLASHYWPWILT